MLHAGQILADRYRIVALLGHGGMGEVYEAEDTVLRVPVALKTIRGEVDGDALRRFQREVVLSRHVAHSNVCRVFDFGSDPVAGAFYTMELLRGETLADIVKSRGPLRFDEARSIAIQVAEALEAAHASGIIHRDLKPGNIFITSDGRVVVTDFGLAKQSAFSAMAGGAETASHIISGTPAYMSPEQMTGGAPSPSVDLYALGVVMYEMTTGRLPWDDAPGVSRLSATPQPPGVHPVWDAATMRCLEVSPSKRFDSATALRLALRGQKMPRKFPVKWAAAAAILVLAIFGIFFMSARQSWKPAPEAVAWYNRGLSALHDGDYNSAARQLGMAAAADPNFAMAHARLAEAWAEQDYADQARQSMLQATAIATNHPVYDRIDALRLIAIQMTVARDFPGALSRYREIANANRDADTLFDLARALERNAQTDDAIAQYREAIALQDSYAAAWAKLGALLGRKADYPAAYAAFDKAQTLYNTAGNLAGVAEVDLRRSVTLTTQGRTADALRVLDSALKLAETTGFESQRIRILLRRGVLARLNERSDQAESYVSEALRLADENRMELYSLDGLLDLGSVYLQKRDLPSAEKHYSNALRIARSQNSRFHEARAMALIASVRAQQGRLDDARSGAEKALTFFRSAGYRNNMLGVLTLLAQVRAQSGDSAGALTAFEEQLKLIPAANARALAAAHLRVGIALAHLERLPEALVHLDAALETNESVTRAYAAVNKAAILVLTGAGQQAAQILNDAQLLSEPSGIVSLRAAGVRAVAALQEGRFSEAVREAETALGKLGTKDPAFARELEATLAVALASLGNTRRASSICESILKDRTDLRVSATALLSCAEVELAASRRDSARADAAQAAELFGKLEQPESQWRACSIGVLALTREQAASKEIECENIRKTVAERWGKELWERYLTRPDVLRSPRLRVNSRREGQHP
jgi:tetratricopeptide (TPR) repeat protein